MVTKKIKIELSKDRKIRAPHRPTRVHKSEKKYTRKGRAASRRRKSLLREWQQQNDG
jgi:hypothetical protein